MSSSGNENSSVLYAMLERTSFIILKGQKKTNLTGEQFIEADLGTGGRR